jgi:alpha-galactosidase
MSLWAILAAPLLAGNDLSKMTDETKSILMNRAVIAIDQDKLGKQGDRISQQGDKEIWSKPLSGGRAAVGMFNRSTVETPITFKMTADAAKAVAVTDVWSGKKVEVKDGTVTLTVPAHGVALLVVGN